jgi:hypothetical protein
MTSFRAASPSLPVPEPTAEGVVGYTYTPATTAARSIILLAKEIPASSPAPTAS